MRTKTLFIAIVLTLIGMLVHDHASLAEDNKMIVMRDYLREMGVQLDCYFTVESVGKDGWLNNSILDAMVVYKPVKKIDELVAVLTNRSQFTVKSVISTAIVDVAVDKYSRVRPIIQIRDRALDRVTNYGLMRRVTFEFQGTPDGLLDYLAGLVRTLRRQNIISIGAGPTEADRHTPVKLTESERHVRDVLTDAVPLENYSRIIWSSYTDGRENSPMVTIKFHGEAQLHPR